MKPTARRIRPGYRGPRTCHRCGKQAADDQVLVSANPAIGEENPDYCAPCVILMNQALQKEQHDSLAFDLKELAVMLARVEFGNARH